MVVLYSKYHPKGLGYAHRDRVFPSSPPIIYREIIRKSIEYNSCFVCKIAKKKPIFVDQIEKKKKVKHSLCKKLPLTKLTKKKGRV